MSSIDELPEITENTEIEELIPTEYYDDFEYIRLFFSADDTTQPTTEEPDITETESPFSINNLSEEDRERFQIDVARLTHISSKHTEKDNSKARTEKRKINYEVLNECLIVLVICLLIVLVGQRYIMQKGEREISVIYDAVNETTTVKSFSTEKGERININTADADELMTLDGIGKQKAEAILDYRLTYGKFREIADIMNVPGIGEGIFENIKDHISIE